MVTGATSLSLVRDELFATMEQAEQGLEQFIAERQNGSLLQHAVECLQQIRGTLNLIELAGAELLAQEVPAAGDRHSHRRQRGARRPAGSPGQRPVRAAPLPGERRGQSPGDPRAALAGDQRSALCRRAAGAAGKLLLQRPPGYPAAAEHRHRPPAFPKPNWARKAGGCATCTRSACSA